jgi:hypothetical protein
VPPRQGPLAGRRSHRLVRSSRLARDRLPRYLLCGVEPVALLHENITVAQPKKKTASATPAKTKSATGLMSEGAKKMVSGVTDAAKQVAGKKPKAGAKGPLGNIAEGAKKLARGAGKAMGMSATKAKRPGGK